MSWYRKYDKKGNVIFDSRGDHNLLIREGHIANRNNIMPDTNSDQDTPFSPYQESREDYNYDPYKTKVKKKGSCQMTLSELLDSLDVALKDLERLVHGVQGGETSSGQHNTSQQKARRGRKKDS